MKINVKDFRIDARKDVALEAWPTRVDPLYTSKADYATQLAGQVETLSALQDLLYVTDQHSVLLLFQAMDAAGKDGAIKHVMSGVNPQGCQVFSFKHPGPTELQHDFLWRFQVHLPERGRIGIFNRSYYEEVLIARVHPEILQSEEHVDPNADQAVVFKNRYKSIRAFERHLCVNGVKVVKIYLHLSQEEQRLRFLERIKDPDKNWKLSLNDMQERKFWADYMRAYERAIGETSTHRAPWHVVPADDKENARLIVAQILVESLKALDMKPPKVSDQTRRVLAAFQAELQAEAPKD